MIYYAVVYIPSEEAVAFRTMVENSSIGIFIVEKEKRSILYANSSLLDMLGISRTKANDYLLKSSELPVTSRLLTNQDIATLNKKEFKKFEAEVNGRHFSILAKSIS
ncbi:MAG: PAS domain-containing protein [Bacilli bacterium]